MTEKRKRVPRRNRYDIKYFFPDGASLRWFSRVDRNMPGAELVEALREIANVIEDSVKRGTR